MQRRGSSGKVLLGEAYAESDVPIASAIALDDASAGWGGGNNWNNGNSNGGGGGGYVVDALPAQTVQALPDHLRMFPHNPQINQQFFFMYADVVKQIDQLRNADSSLNQVNGAIQNSQKTIGTLKQSLARANVDQPKIEAKLKRNENPRFFHYMQVNRKEKVAKLQTNLQNCIASQEKWTGEKQAAEAALASQLQEQARLKNAVGTKRQLEQKRLDMYEQTVASVPPTPRLQQIDSHIHAQNQNLSMEQSLLQQVDNTISLIKQALQLYGQSLAMLQQAFRANTTAQTINTIDMFSDPYYGPNYFETMEQAQRDALINESQMPAIQAYQIIAQAWQLFPNEARRRYPSLAAQIGKAPLPRLRGANFGNTLMTGLVFGDIGDMYNNQRAYGKIEENMMTINQCIQIMNQQLSLVVALRNAIATNVAQMSSQLQTMNTQRKQERDHIFECVKRTVLSS